MMLANLARRLLSSSGWFIKSMAWPHVRIQVRHSAIRVQPLERLNAPKLSQTLSRCATKTLTTPISKYRMKPSFHRSNGERLAKCRTSSWRLFT
ncbi:uncharacterized protein K444DRAFT_258045 [Hyaloscypha bicolor E]|uniref:Uncharacterized protein n=1 Tax=Hyaloscypha bicolor E TaxID=1095630 RepID=A0A2J6SNF6_9HELO|nr:uncharacterized protein K444DRAFT_258045 [Hyaloscypha bicolor E]PMD52294.1 hypothetical protein K444DRAFT_258045 [Hyaloscypha bicolor E]